MFASTTIACQFPDLSVWGIRKGGGGKTRLLINRSVIDKNYMYSNPFDAHTCEAINLGFWLFRIKMENMEKASIIKTVIMSANQYMFNKNNSNMILFQHQLDVCPLFFYCNVESLTSVMSSAKYSCTKLKCWLSVFSVGTKDLFRVYIITTVTWFQKLDHVESTGMDHQINRDASSLIWWSSTVNETWSI